MAANMMDCPLPTELKTSVQNPSDFIKREEGFSDHVTIKAEPLDPSYDQFETYPPTSEAKHNHCPLLVPQADSNDFPIEVKQECDLQDGISEGYEGFLQHSEINVKPEDDLMVKTDVEDEATDKEITEYDDGGGSAPEEEYYESQGLHFLKEDTSDLDPPVHKRLKMSPNSDSLHKCSHCQKVFDKEGVLDHHLYKVPAGPKEPHTCHKCGEDVKCRTHLWAHLLTHKGQMPHICKDCGMVFKTGEGIKKHMLCKHFKDDHTCEFCQKRFESMFEMVNHVLTHCGVSEPQYKCLACSETFEKKDDLQKHLLTHNNNVFVCKVCLKAFDTKDNLSTHNCDVLCCNLCLMTFSSEQQLQNHRSLHNISGGDSVCPKCGKAFAMKYKYFKHIRECYEDGPFPCEGCNELFEKRSELTQHLQSKHACKELYLGKGSSLETSDIVVNRGFHKIKCSRCFKTFKYLYMFSKHKISCLKEGKDSRVQSSFSTNLSVNQKPRLYKYDRHTMLLKRKENESKNLLSQTNNTASTCKLSPKTFESKESLTIQNCDLEQCNACRMTFSSKVQLEDHMKLHNISEGQKLCLECGKIFVTSAEKYKHMQDYHKLRSFHCKKCLAVFQNGTELMLHNESVHASQREYYCRMCSLEFPTLADLKEHQMNDVGKCKDSSLETGEITVNHVDQKMKCNVFSKTFKSQYTFSKHKKNCLKDDTDSSMQSSSSIDPAANQKTQLHKYDRHPVRLKRKEDESKILLSHTNDTAFTCKICLKTFQSKESLTTHNCDLEQCSVCLMTFSSKEQLEDHVKLHNISEGQKVCLECGKIFDTRFEKYKHMTKYHNLGSFQCKKCLAVFENGTELMLHNESVHASQKMYFCRMCSLEFPTLADLNEHQMNDVGKCKSSSLETGEIVVNHGDQKIKCDGCSKTFKSQYTFSEHKKNCLKESTDSSMQSSSSAFTCKLAPKTSESKESFTMQNCDLEQCRVCLMTFSSKVHLEDHMKLHNISEGQKVCLECGKIFATRFGKYKHIKRCHKLGSFHCKKCLAVFQNGRELMLHNESVHASQNVYFCRMCSLGFPTLADWKEHQMNDEGKCSFCSRQFSSHTLLFEHTRYCHNKSPLGNLQSSSSSDVNTLGETHENKDSGWKKLQEPRYTHSEHIKEGAESTVKSNSSSDLAAYVRKIHLCTDCGLEFGSPAYLASHKKSHVRKCYNCMTAFESKDMLSKHMEMCCKECCCSDWNMQFSSGNVFMQQCDNDSNTSDMTSALCIGISDNKNDDYNLTEKKVIQVNGIAEKNVKQYCRKEKSSLGNRQEDNAELNCQVRAWNDENNKKRAMKNVRQYGRKARNNLVNTVVKKKPEGVIDNENSLMQFTSAIMMPVVKTEPDEIGIENSVTQYVTGGEEETMAMPTVKIEPCEAVSEHATEQGSVADTLQSFNSHSAVFVQNANNMANLLPDNKVTMKVVLKKQGNGGATDSGVANQFVVIIRHGETTASAAIANSVQTSTNAEAPETEIIVPD